MSAPVMAEEIPKVAAPPGVTAIVIPFPSVATEELGRDGSVVPTIYEETVGAPPPVAAAEITS